MIVRSNRRAGSGVNYLADAEGGDPDPRCMLAVVAASRPRITTMVAVRCVPILPLSELAWLRGALWRVGAFPAEQPVKTIFHGRCSRPVHTHDYPDLDMRMSSPRGRRP